MVERTGIKRMKAKADKLRVALNLDGLPEVTLTLTTRPENDLNEILGVIANGKELDVEIKQHRKKRSLDANSYCWVLIGKIAEALNQAKDDIYIRMLTSYGQREKNLISVVSDGVDAIMSALDNHVVEVGRGFTNGKEFVHLAILIGSSKYDSKEMSVLIDGIVYEAKELGIETMPQEQLDSMKNSWKNLK